MKESQDKEIQLKMEQLEALYKEAGKKFLELSDHYLDEIDSILQDLIDLNKRKGD
ncbi:hypothetical protein G7062_01885 [Erysipelothrix sp. HDW6C]|uniref:hypothetical protein n=1 Tax=Erysipelothrix sp. HDW6C TaxID=2714930 RepID=UPI00140D42B9|nr:hypothetical protein [Erysipelothrix sp. HDW6C]QIK69107.1 hypothetical protein G7062_01885 [Erysipelothrix sp. HDW6C]